MSLSHLVTWSREKIDLTSSSMLENVVYHGIQLDLLLSVQEWALASTFNLQYAARHPSSMMTYYDVSASNRVNLVYPLSDGPGVDDRPLAYITRMSVIYRATAATVLLHQLGTSTCGPT